MKTGVHSRHGGTLALKLMVFTMDIFFNMDGFRASPIFSETST